jgi:hypothetical protein
LVLINKGKLNNETLKNPNILSFMITIFILFELMTFKEFNPEWKRSKMTNKNTTLRLGENYSTIQNKKYLILYNYLEYFKLINLNMRNKKLTKQD